MSSIQVTLDGVARTLSPSPLTANALYSALGVASNLTLRRAEPNGEVIERSEKSCTLYSNDAFVTSPPPLSPSITVTLDGSNRSVSPSPQTGNEIYSALSIASNKTLHRSSPSGEEIERSEKSYTVSEGDAFVTSPQ